MGSRLKAVRTLVLAYAVLAAGLVGVLQGPSAAAQGDSTEIVIGLQNDMTSLNFWNPETNTVWNFYQVGWSFETLFATDPDLSLYPVLADPTRGNTGPEDDPGYDIRLDLDSTGHTVDVFIRTMVTFHDGSTMDADDVVFSFQTKAWSTEQTIITEALWWDAPRWPHWSGGGAMSHIGVEKIDATTVRFHLAKPFALFFPGTLAATIIPTSVWVSHIDPAPPVNISDPGTTITDSADRSIDFAYGAGGEIPSTYGTGWFKVDSWSPRAGSHISIYDNYWGKGVASASRVWRSVTYPFYPEHLRSIQFVIYSSLDVISLALQRGDIDTLIWSLTPGFLTQVRSNPSIGVEQVTDRGFFYVAFNLRRAPWGDPTGTPARTAASLALRKAISMAIDKDYIVNTLMGGFGIKGAQGISIHNSFYVNSSATSPPFDLAGATSLLNSAGLTDQNGDGFRDYIDGSPIRATILTPPKDYDPVRADAGIMISNNLKRIGLNIDAAPTSFDTIVSKAFTEVDFDIYILGWLLGDFPELYIKDFYHTAGDVAINPAGSNAPGYNNPTVDAQIDQALITVDTATRVQLLKDVQGHVANDIPWNVLYYRKNLNAYRNDRWVGWVNTPPQIYNFWSLAKLQPAGAIPVPPPSGALTVALTAPERALAGHTVTIEAYVSQNLSPASGATVVLNATFGSDYRVLTATTDVRGKASFAWVVPVIQGNLLLTATATAGTATGTATKLLEITVGPPAPITQLRLSTPTPVIGVGGTATVSAEVRNGQGNPASGVGVTVDTTLLLGTISPTSATTGSNGIATFTYTAPANANQFPNQHLADILKASISVPDTVAGDTQVASIVIFVENDNPPAWYIVDVQGTPNPVLRLTPPGSVTVDVRVSDYSGAAVVGVDVEAVVPAGDTNVSMVPTTDTTDALGMAQFVLSPTGAAVQGNVPLRFRVVNWAAQVSDQIALLFSDIATPGFGAVLDIADRTLVSAPAPGSTTVTATVFDQLGTPAVGAAVIFQISYGDLGLAAQFPWAYDYSYAAAPYYQGQGLDMNFFGLGSLGPSFEDSVGQGTGWGVENFVEDFEVVGNVGALTGVYIDSCDPTGVANDFPVPYDFISPWPADFPGTYVINATGVTDINGQISDTLTAVPHRIDSPIQVRVWVGSATGSNRLHVEADACNFVSSIESANFMVDSGLVVRRAPVFALGDVSFDAPILTSEDRFATVTAQFYIRGGAVAPDVQVFLVRGFGTAARNVGNARTSRSGTFYGTLTADASGVVTHEVAEQYTRRKPCSPWLTCTNVDTSALSLSQPIFYSFIPADPRYAFGGREQLFYGGGNNYGDFWIAPTFAVLIAKIPFEFTMGYLFVPSATAFATAAATTTLLAEDGTTTVTVTVTTGTGAPVANATVWTGPLSNITDANGVATFQYRASGLGAIEQLAVVRTTDDQVLRAWFGVVASHPVLSVTSITVTPRPAGQASTITVGVTNQLAVAGPATVVVSVGGTPIVAQVITIGASASTTVDLSYAFSTAGSVTVTSGSQSATAVIPAPPGADLGLAIGLLIVGLIVGILIGIMIFRMRKGPSAAAPMGEEKEPESMEPQAEELESERP